MNNSIQYFLENRIPGLEKSNRRMFGVLPVSLIAKQKHKNICYHQTM